MYGKNQEFFVTHPDLKHPKDGDTYIDWESSPIWVCLKIWHFTQNMAILKRWITGGLAARIRRYCAISKLAFIND